MGESGSSYSRNDRLDIHRILLEAQNRWLRPAEISRILENFQNFQIAREPPNRPPSGSVFLFDRKQHRYFRRDGHNWRKKRDGKTVKEAHERLKVGSVDVLHCYYAHGEDNECFQRRSYWLLDEERSNIVFVHYRDTKGNKTSFMDDDSYKTDESGHNNYDAANSLSSTFQPYNHQGAPQVTTDATSCQTSEWEDAESAYRNETSPGIHSNLEKNQVLQMGVGSDPHYPISFSDRNYQEPFSVISDRNFGSLMPRERTNDGYPSLNSMALPPISQFKGARINNDHGTELLDQVVSGVVPKIEGLGTHIEELQLDFGRIEHHSIGKSNSSDDRKPDSDGFDAQNDFVDLDDSMSLIKSYENEEIANPIQIEFLSRALITEGGCVQSEGSLVAGADKINPSLRRRPLLEGLQEGLKKLDSFDRWMSKELGDVAEPIGLSSSSGAYWETIQSEDDSGMPTEVPPVDNYLLGPSLSHEQLFSIIDFSPNWAYSDSDVKVLVMGRFLKNAEEMRKQNWACMFGELEVPAEIISDGVLRCHTPFHECGRVSFYVTCSNRLACSEFREFEFRPNPIRDLNPGDAGTANSEEIILRARFGKLLSLGSSSQPLNHLQGSTPELSQMSAKISALLKDDAEWERMLNVDSCHDELLGKDQLLQKLLKENLHGWLLLKISEGGKGASVLDEGGQGVLHFAAALGYHWAIPPTVVAGVNVNFRDVNGWTALHWAAYYGRECIVTFLISLGGDPGLFTHPTSKRPIRTPADLAASNGHKGIAGFLAEAALSSHLSSLELKDSKNDESSPRKAASNCLPTPASDGRIANGSLSDSIAAVINASQSAARIHEVFRLQSFQRRKQRDYAEATEEEERALSLLAHREKKSGHNHAAAAAVAVVRIQNKFRSWKGRKDFLITRERIIKIQALVRGHQVRKNYRKLIWSVRVLDGVLRWRRKGRGLSVFKQPAASSSEETEEEEEDPLRKERKQAEERLQKALARVKSMVQYPEARAQYRRLLNVVPEMQEMKAAYDRIVNNPEGDFDDVIDLDALLEEEEEDDPTSFIQMDDE